MRVLLFLWLLVLALPSAAKTVDLSTRTEEDGQFEIAFCARPSPDTKRGLPGHMFVSFSQLRTGGKREFLAIGHTVAPGTAAGAAAWSYFGEPISGYLAEERYSSIGQDCLLVVVNQDDYSKAYAMTNDPLAAMGIVRSNEPVLQAYKLGEDDCMTFLIRVAHLLRPRGLKVPERGATELPMVYVGRLIASN